MGCSSDYRPVDLYKPLDTCEQGLVWVVAVIIRSTSLIITATTHTKPCSHVSNSNLYTDLPAL